MKQVNFVRKDRTFKEENRSVNNEQESQKKGKIHGRLTKEKTMRMSKQKKVKKLYKRRKREQRRQDRSSHISCGG